MKVFLCWSGDRSKALAEALFDWLPKVIQKLDPWMSKESIPAGGRWRDDVAKHLDECQFGILCITADNIKAEWIHFEAGALSKNVSHGSVVPYLHGIEKSSIKDPLAQFQAMKATREETFDLLKALNTSLSDGKLTEVHLKEQFEVWWERMEQKLRTISEMPPPSHGTSTKRGVEDILEELVQRIRAVESTLSTLTQASTLAPSTLVTKPATPAMPGGAVAVVEPTIPGSIVSGSKQ